MEQQQLPCREIKISLSINQQDTQKYVKTKRRDSASVGVKQEIARDLWKRFMEEVEENIISISDGNKSKCESWKAAFKVCIDQAPTTPGHKLLQLRQHLTGEALKCIKNLGHSARAYDTSKNRSEKIGGSCKVSIAY